MTDTNLIQSASKARRKAYSQDSRFRVGAALLTLAELLPLPIQGMVEGSKDV